MNLINPRREKKALAMWAGAKAAQDRDRDLSTGRALRSQGGIGAGPLAPEVTLAAQRVELYDAVFLYQKEADLPPLRFAEILTD